MLSLTIITNNIMSRVPSAIATSAHHDQDSGTDERYPRAGLQQSEPANGGDEYGDLTSGPEDFGGAFGPADRETTITQDIPVIVLAPAAVASVHQPVCPEPDVHIILPPLLQLKAISERFTKLAISPSSSSSSSSSSTSRQGGGGGGSSSTQSNNNTSSSSSSHPRLLLSANMHGTLRISVSTPHLKIQSQWEGLTNPELDPTQVEGGEQGIREHASTRMKERYGEEAWSCVRVEGKDWGRVLGVGRMGGRVIACTFSEDFVPSCVHTS